MGTPCSRRKRYDRNANGDALTTANTCSFSTRSSAAVRFAPDDASSRDTISILRPLMPPAAFCRPIARLEPPERTGRDRCGHAAGRIDEPDLDRLGCDALVGRGDCGPAGRRERGGRDQHRDGQAEADPPTSSCVLAHHGSPIVRWSLHSVPGVVMCSPALLPGSVRAVFPARRTVFYSITKCASPQAGPQCRHGWRRGGRSDLGGRGRTGSCHPDRRGFVIGVASTGTWNASSDTTRPCARSSRWMSTTAAPPGAVPRTTPCSSNRSASCHRFTASRSRSRMSSTSRALPTTHSSKVLADNTATSDAPSSDASVTQGS